MALGAQKSSSSSSKLVLRASDVAESESVSVESDESESDESESDRYRFGFRGIASSSKKMSSKEGSGKISLKKYNNKSKDFLNGVRS